MDGSTEVSMLPVAVSPTTAAAVIAAYCVQCGAAAVDGGSCVFAEYVTPVQPVLGQYT